MSSEVELDVPDIANKVAEKCIKVYENLPKSGKPSANEYTVLSGMVLCNRATGYMEVVSLGTGTKCLGGSQLSSTGGVLNDSHSEIIARRGFLVYLYDTIKRTLKGERTMFKIVDNKLDLNSDYEFHFYTSLMPCGDGCIMPKPRSKDNEDEQFGLPIFSKESLDSNKRKAEDYIPQDVCKKQKVVEDICRTGAKCLPQSEQDTCEPGMKYHLLGQVRTKPGRGDRTLSVSCSDKIAKWIHLGIQGSLLGLILSRLIYLKSIVIGGGVPYSQASLERALVLRNSNIKIENVPKFEQSSVAFPHMKTETRNKPAPASIVWVNLGESFSEVSANGIRIGVIKKNAAKPQNFLSITKYNLYKQFVEILLLYEKDFVKKLVGPESVVNIPYNQMKKKNKDYYSKWAVVKQDFFKAWTTKPDIWNFCAGVQ